MQKPWMCCHMLSALDGGISGSFMELETTEALARSYASIRSAYQADAWIYGSATTKEFVGPYVQSEAESACDALDLVAKKDAAHYIVSIDPLGEVGWRSPTFVRGGVEAHIIEVLSEETPAAYRGYLRTYGISYITAGAHTLDLAVAADQLFHLFSIRRALICGGGKTNWSFLQQGLVDELSGRTRTGPQCAHRCLFLELCADGRSSGTALGHGARSGAQGRRKRDGEKRPMGPAHSCCGHGALWDPCTAGASDPIVPVPERFLRTL